MLHAGSRAVGAVLRVTEDDAVQVLQDGLLRLPGEPHHEGHIHLGLLGQGDGQSLRGGVHGGDDHLLLDGTLGEHIRLAGKPALVVQHLQRGKQTGGAVVGKGGLVGAGVESAIGFDKGVIQPVQLFALRDNHFLRVVLGLVLNEPPHGVPDANHALHPVRAGEGQLHRSHDAVLPVVELPLDQGIAEVSDAGVGGDGLVGFFLGDLLQVHGGVVGVDVLDSGGQQLLQGLIPIGNAGCLGAVGPADGLHLAQHHIRVLDKVAVHANAVGVRVQGYPVRLNVNEPVPLLQEQNIRGHVRARCTLEGVVREADGPQQVGSLGNVFSDGGVFLVHGALGGHKGNDAAGPHLVQGLGKEVVMDQEVVFVVALVRHLELAEGHVADGPVKEGVGKLGGLVALHGNGGPLIELLGNPT